MIRNKYRIISGTHHFTKYSFFPWKQHKPHMGSQQQSYQFQHSKHLYQDIKHETMTKHPNQQSETCLNHQPRIHHLSKNDTCLF
jgi:hypothetical protein